MCSALCSFVSAAVRLVTVFVTRLPDYRPEAAYTILAVKALMEGTKEAGREICQDEEDFLCSAFFDMSSRGTRVNVQIRLNSHRFKDPGQNGDLHMSQIHYSIHRFTGTGEFVKVIAAVSSPVTFYFTCQMFIHYSIC